MIDSPNKPFFRPGKVILLLVLAVFLYLVALLVWLPAGFAWQQLRPQVPLPPGVTVTQVSGTWWRGAAAAVVRGYPLRFQWWLSRPQLGELALPISWKLDTAGSELQGDVWLAWPNSATVNAHGMLAVDEFEPLIRQSGGAIIDGVVDIERFSLQWQENRVVSVSGLGQWPGGLVSWPVAGRIEQANFPAMEAGLNTTEGGLALQIAARDGAGPAASASVLWNGMLDLQVYKRMLDLAGQPWPDTAQPGDVVFRVRQPLLPGAM